MSILKIGFAKKVSDIALEKKVSSDEHTIEKNFQMFV
jgi:hypothetical protein